MSDKVDTGVKHTLHKISVAIRMISFAIATAILYVCIKLVVALMDQYGTEVEKINDE